MSKLLRWIVVSLIVAGAAYVILAVPFGGRTLWERWTGPGEDPRPPGAGQAAGEGAKRPPDAGTDQLTEQDRHNLDQLIDSKLKEGGDGAPSPGEP